MARELARVAHHHIRSASPRGIPSYPDMTQVTSSTSPSDSSLPRYGFGAEVAFDALIETNPSLFQVYTPRQPSSTSDLTSDHSDAPTSLLKSSRMTPDPVTQATASDPARQEARGIGSHVGDALTRRVAGSTLLFQNLPS